MLVLSLGHPLSAAYVVLIVLPKDGPLQWGVVKHPHGIVSYARDIQDLPPEAPAPLPRHGLPHREELTAPLEPVLALAHGVRRGVEAVCEGLERQEVPDKKPAYVRLTADVTVLLVDSAYSHKAGVLEPQGDGQWRRQVGLQSVLGRDRRGDSSQAVGVQHVERGEEPGTCIGCQGPGLKREEKAPVSG